jgi:hypothetical protein
LPAHRRSALRGTTTSRRRAADTRGRRRATGPDPRPPHRGLPLLLGIGLLAVGVLAGPSVVGNGWRPSDDTDERTGITLAAVPADNPQLGLVYSGLEAARRDSPCAGAYELADPSTCTHGPDPAPTGMKVSRDVSPVTGPAAEPRTPSRESGPTPSDGEIVRDEGGTALAAGEPALVPDAAPGEAAFVMGGHDVACEGDGRSGKRVQVLYLHEFGTTSRYADYLGSIRAWSAGVDGIVDASAGETGGSRHVRFVTTPQCRVDVAEVQVPKGSLGSFGNNLAALDKLGYDRKYLIFADANVYCGIGTFIADRRPGPGNRNNGGPSYGRIDAGCWSAVVATHELAHTLGAQLDGSPNAAGNGHCTDGNDIFCSAAAAKVRAVCPDRKHAQRLDCNHDDYFSTDPKDGSYLDENWNIAQSEFLLRGDGGADVPDAPATAPAAQPTATPSATPSASATAGGTPGAGPAASDDAVPADPAVDGSAPPSPDTETTTPADPPAGSTAPTAAPTEEIAEPVQAVLEFRNPTSTSIRLQWSASAPGATYEVTVDGVTIATTTSTRARLIGLRPGSRYKLTVTDPGRGYVARGEAQTAPAARPAGNSWFVLTNSLTGGAADLYAARSATGTPIVLGGAEGGAQQQFKLVPAGGDAMTLQSRATGKCVAPQGGNQASGVPLVQADCADGAAGQRFLVELTEHGFSLRTASGGLVVGVGSQRFGAHRLLVLQKADGTRHQSWTALPG